MPSESWNPVRGSNSSRTEWVDLFGRHELQNGNLVFLGGGQFAEIIVRQHHAHAVVGVVGLVDIGVLDDVAAFGADAVVFDPAAVLGMDW